MEVMGCALCRVKQEVARSPRGELPRCPQHEHRVLIPWEVLQDNPNDPWLGLVLNERYELINPLGKGGFGSVYLAVQQGHIRYSVAIKLLTRQSPEYLDLFRDEMRVIARLRNPHTVRYLDSGTHQDEHHRDIPFMVMNFVEGETLAHRIIRDGALTPSDVITLLRQLLYSLEEAHQQGIVHRDLKPLNLMVHQKPNLPLHLVVLDFGVARILDEASREATRNRIMGTPYYLAPETLTDHQVTTQTDLFAASVIAYEALCCRSPFLNEELQGIEPYLKLRSLYRKRTKPQPLPSKFSREWKLFFDCALAIDPADRFPDATSMLIALDELERIEDERTQTKRASSRFPSAPVDDFEEEEVTTFFKRHLAGESVDDEELQSMSEIDSSVSIFETFGPAIPPPLPPEMNSDLDVHPSRELPTVPLSQQSELRQHVHQVMHEVQSSLNNGPPERSKVADPIQPSSIPPLPFALSSSPMQSSVETAPTVQLARPDFSLLDASLSPNKASALPPSPAPMNSPQNSVVESEVNAYPQASHSFSPRPQPSYMNSSVHRLNEDTGRFEQVRRDDQSLLLIILQLILMVGLGALFAYIVIRYVLV